MNKIVDKYIDNCNQPSSILQVFNITSLYNNENFREIYRYAMKNDENAYIVLKALTEELDSMDILKACAAAHFCGAIMEKIGTKDCGKAVVDLFIKSIVLSYKYINKVSDSLKIPLKELKEDNVEKADIKEMFEKYPDCLKAYYGCGFLTIPAMSVLVRDRNCLAYLRKKDIFPIMQYLNDFIDNIYYAVELYKTCTDFNITVLAPSVHKGFNIRVNDISNCFHLITLLEAEMHRKRWIKKYKIADYNWNDFIYKVAIGEISPEENCSVHAHQQYYTYHALQSNGDYKIVKPSTNNDKELIDPKTLIWGEMPPEAIPLFNGKAIIIMDSKGMFGSRSWDLSFINKCHDFLSPKVTLLDELSSKEVDNLLTLIKER